MSYKRLITNKERNQLTELICAECKSKNSLFEFNSVSQVLNINISCIFCENCDFFIRKTNSYYSVFYKNKGFDYDCNLNLFDKLLKSNIANSLNGKEHPSLYAEIVNFKIYSLENTEEVIINLIYELLYNNEDIYFYKIIQEIEKIDFYS